MPARTSTVSSRKPRTRKFREWPNLIDFGRDICGNLEMSERREWLVTNGIGGFASGTIAGSLTRRYHGLLIAALNPPVGRTLLVSKLEETVEYQGESFQLATNHWHDGTVAPTGFLFLERFHLEGTTPVWTFAIGDARLEKRIWMDQGQNTTRVHYAVTRSTLPIRLLLRAFINNRDYHGTTDGSLPEFSTRLVDRGLHVTPASGPSFWLSSSMGTVEQANTWYRNFDLPLERERELADCEHHVHIGTWIADLLPTQTLTWRAGTTPGSGVPTMESRESQQKYEQHLLTSFLVKKPSGITPPAWIQQLLLSADQFLVMRPLGSQGTGHSIIAGYHWFGDWGRDTMISLPGLTLTTKRFDLARSILSTFAQYADQGMLPNRFPDAGEAPEYNTVDATLWFIEAVRHYLDATQDRDFLESMFPVLVDMLTWYRNGTRYGIRMDPTDHLLQAGEPGVQLTWMDAKVEDWVVTPRMGKPIEINALWYQAWLTLGHMAKTLSKPCQEFFHMGKAVQQSFQRFWHEPSKRCYDVIDGPHGPDLSPRPNQLFALSLPFSPLTTGQQQAVLTFCTQQLHTTHGLRSLGPDSPQYVGSYLGNVRQRDGAYHQGTVWGWLLGPLAFAHYRVYRDANTALSFLEPMRHQLHDYGLGTLGEIFDGHPPHTPRGCIAQAWTVAEVLRAWHVIQSSTTKKPTTKQPTTS